jgi:hypothetical protein
MKATVIWTVLGVLMLVFFVFWGGLDQRRSYGSADPLGIEAPR